MSEQFSRWDASDYLATEEDIVMYFEACLEEDPGDGSLIRKALGDIAKARGMSKLSRVITGVSVITGVCYNWGQRSFI